MKRFTFILIFSLIFTNFYAANPGSINNYLNGTMSAGNEQPYSNKRLNTVRFGFEFGRVGSKFAYRNSEGEQLENLIGSTRNHLALTGKVPIKQSNTYLYSAVSYNTYSAQGSDNIVGNYYDWNVNYCGANLGIGYEFSDFDYYWYRLNANKYRTLSMYTQLSVAAEFLVLGTQTINNQVYNVRGVEQFDKPFLFARGGLGVVYHASEILSIYGEYMGGMGFSVFKSDPVDLENLNFITHNVSLGIQISLPPF